MRYSTLLLSALLAFGSVAQVSTSFANENEKNEKTTDINKLPAPARETVLREAKGGKVLKIDEMTKKGETVYEAHIQKGSEETGIVVDAQGKVLARHSEKMEKEKPAPK